MILSGCAGILTRTTDAESEALSLTDLKDHLRIDEVADHDVLLLLITAVRQATEEYLEQTLVTSTYTLAFDKFPAQGELINLRMGPIASIESVQYFDSDNASQNVAGSAYEFDRNGRLRPTSTLSWPSTYDRLSAVTVSYTAGQAHAGLIPEDIRLAMRLMIGDYDQSREDIIIGTIIASIPIGYRYLLNAHRVHQV